MDEFYTNPLAQKNRLQADDLRREAKLLRLCEDLQGRILTPVPGQIEWRFYAQSLDADQALAADYSTWERFEPRQVWGKSQAHCWFAASVCVPDQAAGQDFVLRFSSQWQDRLGSTDPQCLIYLDGKIAQALDGNHLELLVERQAVPGRWHDVLIDAFTFFDRPLLGFECEFLLRHSAVERLYYDLQTPLQVALRLPQHDLRRHGILDLVEQALLAVDRRLDPGVDFAGSLPAAQAIADRIYQMQDIGPRPKVTAVGHTHIDVAWLWRVLHTRDKTARSFSTALALIEDYPEFVFMYNQAALFAFLKQDYPELWGRVKAQVAAGRFEIEGAMWVEPDVNIISGESIVRQFLLGRQFHQQEFGVTPKVVWLPDTFGYSANLPQLMARSGLEHFVTSKLSWNDSDRQPYDSFIWSGIDGSRCKAQLITTQEFESDRFFTTYNSDLSVGEVMGAWMRYEPKALNNEVLVCFGHGDGGGGPTRGMIETGKRLARGIAGAPDLQFGGIGPFLSRMGQKMAVQDFPVWEGELYLQFHRGTLTSVAKNKRNNRRAEHFLQELEFLSVLAMRAGQAYPDETLEALWKQVLTNQFHDILPGTSIAEVYEDSDADYAALFDPAGPGQAIWQGAAGRVLGPVVGPVVGSVAGQAAGQVAGPVAGSVAGQVAFVNFTSQRRQDPVVFNAAGGEQYALEMGGQQQRFQTIHRADGRQDLLAPVAGVPPLGYAFARVVEAGPVQDVVSSLSVSLRHLENERMRVEFDAAGLITSVFDKGHQRDLIPPGARANELIAYEDRPVNWEAWDIDRSFTDTAHHLADDPVQIKVVETGPHRVALRIERRFSKSKITQVISLQAGARQLDFDSFVDWQERQTVLKTCFPFDLNSNELRAEIQFGHVKRSTHSNTSWDAAQYEASMQRWLDMSEADFGAALLNDCKYAYDAVGQTVRLTLLCGPVFPDPAADLGLHQFKYALYVHEGLADLAQVVRAAERLNSPLAVLGELRPGLAKPEPVPAPFSLVQLDQENVSLQTVKKAQDSDAIVLRLFEHSNIRSTVTLRFGIALAQACLVNLMEDHEQDLELQNNQVVLQLRPFEIVSLRITPAATRAASPVRG